MKRLWIACARRCGHIWADRKGSAISMMAAGLIPVVAAMGASIDAGRMYMVKSQLQAGVDAAALAGARAFAVTDESASSRTKQVEAYFYGNFNKTPAYMGVRSLTLTPHFETVNGINVTTVSAQAIVPMTFMRIFGVADPTLVAVAKAELQPRPLEVMVVLDDTGSMRFNLSAGRTRETALKEAANDFIDILHQGAASRRDLAVGFIGYDVTANVGHLLPAGAVAAVEGFNSFTSAGIAVPSHAQGNNLAWKGCVMADSTVRDVNATHTFSEANAWDLTRVLPGEGGNPPVQPYFVPPMYVPNVRYDSTLSLAQHAGANDPSSNFYGSNGGEASNNLYKLDQSAFGSAGADYLAQQQIYRNYLFDYYIGLNNGSANASDDVVRNDDGSYFDPQTRSKAGGGWKIEWRNLPRYNSTLWSNPTNAVVNPNGGRVDDIKQDTTPAPSPNWQCPEQAMLLMYGRPASDYKRHIANNHAAIYPGNGTIHHAGMLWGYRLLVRDDVFTRSNPTNERPRRALVFMTDGANEITEAQNGWLDRTFTWYGRWSDGRISANPGDGETQMLRRFEKTCMNLQRETNPPEVYIIALVANSAAINTAFNRCAPGRVYRTSTTDGLKKAFQDVAAELVDLHLIQ